ncbi:phage major capsid protein [Nitrosomonas eutropha]|uniref:HK97 family phage major capsid protein n=2 Tax=Nitrosomonas eutropha TaxID=916 RepID=A0ABX5M887_9PROT|nr:phage major capsid protein [Nitrosomonas eutropha]ABI59715.1 phage major capsid protein, HK97 family protein [Nitrosomonas eutropha C91]PXV82486.1 HK97 family phage major capsid protein [Nitrosomonas eutropha]
MAQTLQELRERHAALAKQTRELVENNNGSWQPEHQEKYDQQLAELDDLKNQADRICALHDRIAEEAMADRAVEAVQRSSHGRNGSNAQLDLFAKWVRGGDRAMTAEDWTTIRNTMSTTTPGEGGHTVPTEVVASIIEVLKAYGGVREVASVISTAAGNQMNFPTSDGTSETGELIAENTTATAQDPTFGVVTLNTYKFSSKIVAAPFELLQDSAVDIQAFISRRLGERLARVLNTYFTTGTGTNQPKGVVTAAASGKVGTTGQTTTVIFDDLVDLIHSVDPAYRAASGVRFMMNDSVLKSIRKMKDTQGRPVFLPGYDGLGGAMADTLLGYQITINQDMAAMAANAKSILFGDFSRYTIRDVMGMTLFRFEDSAYIKLGQIGFLAWMRSGGTLTDGGAPLKFYQNSAT